MWVRWRKPDGSVASWLFERFTCHNLKHRADAGDYNRKGAGAGSTKRSTSPSVPGADDLLGGVNGWQLLQQVAGQIQSAQVQETPGQHRGQSHQAVVRQVQVDDTGGHVHEPVQLQPGQLQMTPADVDGLQTQEEELLMLFYSPEEHLTLLRLH